MAKRITHQLAYRAIRIEGGLIPAEELTRLTLLPDPKSTEQTETHYRIAKGLKLRDEIARDFKIALNLWQDFKALRQRQDVRAHEVTVREWLLPLLRDVLHFQDASRCAAIEKAGHQYAVGHAGNGGRVPLVFAGFDEPLDAAAERFGETNPDTGKTRRRSPFMLAQEALNASDASLWAIVSNGLTLRILRDNASLTRPAYIEVDLEALFNEELLADFSAFWLLGHASRFGTAETQPSDCPWERWRAAGQQSGVTVRGKLRDQVAKALRALGTGFLSHPANGELRSALQTAEGGYDRQAFFEELLRLVYRLIFLATVEDRRDRGTGERLVFTPEATDDAKARYLAGYSMTWLRERAVRRSQHDRHADLWQALTITFGALARGEPALGLPALGGLFDVEQCPKLDAAQLDNRHLLAAVFQLGWFRADGGLSRVNYRDMGPEELGSVYESLLELVPDLQGLTSPVTARLAFVGDDETDASTKGNTRKLTGSYYTPDSLVQELIKSALEPVIAQAVKANPQRPVEALLSLTICDPACGSGHFLLSAARRLADEVAKYRAAVEREGGVPTPADYRHALRDVIAHCIFGVDKNALAIALAKTALWLEGYAPDRPLTFLDAHLRCGDALLGVLDESILQAGIPEKAFNPLSGDDKDVAKRVKKANREALRAIEKYREKSRQMLSLDLVNEADALSFEALPDDTLDALQTKRKAYEELEAAIAASRARLAANLFVTAFVLPKSADLEGHLPTSQDLWLVLNGDQPRPGVAEVTTRAAAAAQAFHWWQAFPRVKARGGFDVLLGNPPWERIKLQEEEFFATRSPLIAEAQNKAERGRRIGLLADGLLLHTLYPDVEASQGLSPPNSAEIALYQEFVATRRGAEASSLFAHASGRYPLTGVGDVNTYALFSETYSQALSKDGRAGFVVPTGIATDDSTKAFFSELTQSARLVNLFDIENRERIFPAVDSRMKFCLMTLGKASSASFVCFATNTEQFADPRRQFNLGPEEFRLINPNTLTCPVFRSERDAELTKKLYRAAPVLVKEDSPEVSPWGVRLRMMFHMANDSNLFHLEPGRARLPLYEGKMCDFFDHRSGSYEARGEDRGYRVLPETSTEDYENPNYSISPFYWVDAEVVRERLPKDWPYSWTPVFKTVTSPTNERTFLTSLLPLSGVGNSMNLVLPESSISARSIAALIGNMAALVLDYVARQKIGGVNTNYFHVKQLPILPPERYTELDHSYLVPRILELTYTAFDMAPWAADLGYEGPPFLWNPERRALLRAELDAYYARLYGLTRDELRYILDPKEVMGEDYPSETFRVLKEGELRTYGEYRTRRLVLDAWDRLSSQGC